MNRPVHLEKLLREFRTQAEYLAAHPDPVLLLEPYGETTQPLFETPAEPVPTSPSFFDQTSDNLAETLKLTPQVKKAHTPLSARVVWLTKSKRNPFGKLITLGRAGNNDVIIPHPCLSKLHCMFRRQGEGWLVEDRKTTNGSYLNGLRLEADQQRPIGSGSSLRLADVIQARFFDPDSFWSYCQTMRLLYGAAG